MEELGRGGWWLLEGRRANAHNRGQRVGAASLFLCLSLSLLFLDASLPLSLCVFASLARFVLHATFRGTQSSLQLLGSSQSSLLRHRFFARFNFSSFSLSLPLPLSFRLIYHSLARHYLFESFTVSKVARYIRESARVDRRKFIRYGE